MERLSSADRAKILQQYAKRQAKDMETMLRMYLLLNWYHLSDEGVEEAIYDSHTMKIYLKLDFSKESVPYATTLLKFRHILEENGIRAKLIADVKDRLDRGGMMMHGGTIVDATIISPRVQQKTRMAKEIRKCTRQKKATKGITG